MNHDELYESDAYFGTEDLADDLADLNAPLKPPPLNRRKQLLAIANDKNESFSRRSDARRLLETADILSLKDFERSFSELMSQ
ncbi:hypothetical protein NA78x_000354 [Anatilimnocola sp. NA78]|uniref:hypothetical protein n=1 Tax=Anatilimnocola sp. NA78 TaxID=3415683 RepID=UPI003CE461D5